MAAEPALVGQLCLEGRQELGSVGCPYAAMPAGGACLELDVGEAALSCQLRAALHLVGRQRDACMAGLGHAPLKQGRLKQAWMHLPVAAALNEGQLQAATPPRACV